MKTIYLLFLLFLGGCFFDQVEYNDVNVKEQPGKELCSTACDNLIRLQCQVANCYSQCYQQHLDGYFWNTECLSNINSCSDIQTACKSIIK